MQDENLLLEYRSRINRVEDYIQENIATELNLDTLSGIAAFSKYHFGRIFAMLTGETLFQYIQRSRIEKAASMLLANPGAGITDIALSCGFNSSQAFSRSFRQRFGISASRWRSTGGQTPETLERIHSYRFTNRIETEHMPREVAPVRVSVVDTDDIEVLYVRYSGPFQGDTQLFEKLYSRLFRWTDARSLRGPESRTFCLIHDNPAITDDRKIRLSCCVSIEGDVQPGGDIGRMTIRGGRYARGEFIIDDRQYAAAWSYMYAVWLPSSGYQPDEQPAFEEYPAVSQEEREAEHGRHPVHIWLPIRPL